MAWDKSHPADVERTRRPIRPLVRMIDGDADQGRVLVAAVRAAAALHRMAWDALVPDQFTVDVTAEPAEEAAYAEMGAAKQRLCDHIRRAYGLSLRELIELAG